MSTTQNTKDISINELNPSTRRKISTKLNIKHTLGGDFRTFAAEIGMSNDDIALISQKEEAAEQVLAWWETKKAKEATVKNLRKILQNMSRDDIIRILDQESVEAAKMSTDQVDANGNHVEKAPNGSNNGLQLHLAEKNGTPSPPVINLMKIRCMCPIKIEWSEATKTPIDVLLIVVNNNEFRAVYKILPEPKKADSGNQLGEVYFGQIGENRVALLRCSMGAGGKTGMQATCIHGINELNPRTIIGVGVCFGMKDNQKLADVLVSTKFGNYSPCRVNSNGSENRRGVNGFECDARLSKLFGSNGTMGWKSPCQDEVEPDVFSGLIISGPQLVDNKDRKEKLKEWYPEALGGEMEGEGLYNICELFKVPWIVCKAISDWADGTKNKEWQPFAAAVAASFVEHVLQENYVPEKKPEDQSLSHKRAATPDEVDAGDGKTPKRRKILKIGNINGATYQKLCMELNKVNPGKDYIALAGAMDYGSEEIKNFQLRDDAANALLDNWKTKTENDVPCLVKHLKAIGRGDLVAMLEELSS